MAFESFSHTEEIGFKLGSFDHVVEMVIDMKLRKTIRLNMAIRTLIDGKEYELDVSLGRGCRHRMVFNGTALEAEIAWVRFKKQPLQGV